MKSLHNTPIPGWSNSRAYPITGKHLSPLNEFSRLVQTWQIPDVDKRIGFTPLISPLPPWQNRNLPNTFCIDYLPHSKENLSTQELTANFFEQKHNITADVTWYTDGSRSEDGSACGFAVWCPATSQSEIHRVSPAFSICSVELLAIRHALHLASTSTAKSVLICSDSQSALTSIQNENPTTNIVVDIHSLSQLFNSVHFLWVPAHCGIPDNEIVDRLAKQSLSLTNLYEFPIPWPDVSCTVDRAMRSAWTELWQAGDTGRLLFSIKPRPEHWPHIGNLPRSQDVALAALRCRRANLPSIRYFLNKSESPNCLQCRVLGDVSHFLLECALYRDQRQVLRQVVVALNLPFTLEILLGGANLHASLKGQIRDGIIHYLDTTTGFRALVEF